MHRPQLGTSLLHVAAVATAVAVTLLVLSHYGVGYGAVLWYLAVFAVLVALPGTLLGRLILGSRGSLPADLAIGSAFGMIAQFGLWFVSVSLGIGQWIAAGALLIYAPFALVPRLRRHWRTTPSGRTGPWVSWALAALYILALLSQAAAVAVHVPPKAASWYTDMFWHLGNAAGLLTQAVPQDMRIAGEPFHYHWFSNAHVAAMSLGSGIDVTLVSAYLWLPPVLAVGVLLLVVLVRELTGRWWPGLVAAAMMVANARFMVGKALISWGSSFVPFSPSQTYTVWVVSFMLIILVQLWRDGRLPASGWVSLAFVMGFSAGAKASTLPIIVCGLALGLLVDVLRRRGWLHMGVPLVMSAVALLVTLPLVSGGAAGTKIQLLSSVRRNPVYIDALDLTKLEALLPGGLLPPGLLTPTGLAAAGLILGSVAVSLSWLVAAAPVLRRSETTGAGWVLAGIGFAGLCAGLLIDQDGMSQLYFFMGGLPAWFALTGWGLSRLVDVTHAARPREAWLRGVALAAAAGLGWRLLWGALDPAFQGKTGTGLLVMAMGIPVLAAAVVVVKLPGMRRAWALLLLAVAVITGSTLPSLFPSPLPATRPETEATVTALEGQAAVWLRDNSSPGEVVATNVHCASLSQEQPCTNSSFFVSAFTQRPVLVEGWAYTNDAHRRHGENGLIYSQQPFGDRDLFELNEAAFYAPTGAVLDQLRERGVRYLFADSHRGTISPDLANLAPQIFVNGDVAIYDLSDG